MLQRISSSSRWRWIRFPGELQRHGFRTSKVWIENFKDSVLPKFNAVIGNVPFSDLKYDHHGERWFSLHGLLLCQVSRLSLPLVECSRS